MTSVIHIVSLLAVLLAPALAVQVRVSDGLLEGERLINEYGGAEYFSFRGIPYAQPPLGDLRFKAPQPPTPWNNVRSAKEFGNNCLQYDLFIDKGKRSGDEDCLYLNVYTPEITPSEPLPVMVWIHGGGFVSGSGDDNVYGPKFLVRHGVILVTINYRLEVLGFLSLDTEEVPGNAGMKDQVAALRWVNKNIAKFGGDPNNVTIFGESAGGVSVSYQVISPMSKGLFKRAIAQSGVSVGYWAQSYRPRERGFALARSLGLHTDNVTEVYEFLKVQPAESLVQIKAAVTYSEHERPNVEVYFSVTDEKQFGNNERFFYGDMVNAVSKNVHEGVDIMTGYTADEGLMGVAIFGQINSSLEQARSFPQFFVSYPMSLNLPVDDQLELGMKIRDYYFKNQISIPDDWEGLSRYYGMDIFSFPTVWWIRLIARTNKNKAYLYKFTVKSELNKAAHMMGLADILGDRQVVAHSDDLSYLFSSVHMPTFDMTTTPFLYIDRVCRLWVNFAKYGDPTPDASLGVEWKPYSLEKQNYLDLGNQLVAGNEPDAEEIKFWEDTLTEFGQKLYLDEDEDSVNSSRSALIPQDKLSALILLLFFFGQFLRL